MFGDETERDDAVEMRGGIFERFFLMFAQLDQMIDSFGGSFDMAIEHGRVGIDAKVMSRAMHFKPAVGVDFALEDFIVYAVIKNLRAAARQAAEAGGFQLC